MKVNQKKYMAPTVKVVGFMIEGGFAPSLIKSPETNENGGDVPEQNEQMFYRELGGSNE